MTMVTFLVGQFRAFDHSRKLRFIFFANPGKKFKRLMSDFLQVISSFSMPKGDNDAHFGFEMARFAMDFCRFRKGSLQLGFKKFFDTLTDCSMDGVLTCPTRIVRNYFEVKYRGL